MPYPSMSDYREVLQNPKVAFKIPELQTANVKQTPLGLPFLVSGGFALTTCVTTQTNGQKTKWAIRCFHKEVPDLQERYKYISNFLQKQTDNFFVGFQYEPQGILVKGTWYPIVKMAWVEGDSLNEYIEDNLTNPTRLRNLADRVKLISKRLHELKMSHGDLQHGNILVHSSGNPILIDYDGMYVPDMTYKSSNEIGHINFQHPGRSGAFFNEKIDRFSTIVLYLTLLSLASDSTLWKKYHTGENLIFSRKDYQDSKNSELFLELKNIVQLAPLVNRFEQLCFCRIEDIPTLNEFLNTSIALPQSIAAVPSYIIPRQFEIFAANNIQKIVKQDGEKITVIGQVVTANYYAAGKIFFINFGQPWDDYGNYKPFTAVIFTQGITRFFKVKGWEISNLEALKGKYVEITGILGLYPKNGALIPHINLEDPYQLKEITVAEYNKMLTSPPNPPRTTTQPTGSTSGAPSSQTKPLPPPPSPPPQTRVTQPPATPNSTSSVPKTPAPVASSSSSGHPLGQTKPLPPPPAPPPPPPVKQPSPTPNSNVPKTPAPVAPSGSSSQIPSNSSNPSSDDCFIATATFGTSYAKEVVRYRRFRDEYLIKTSLGAAFIRVYYYLGPVLARVIRNNPSLKKKMAMLLSKLSKLLPIEEE